MKLFTVGPVDTYCETTSIYKNKIPYFRTSDFGNLVINCMKRLADLLGTKYNNNIIYLTASGTAAMEATIENCLRQTDKVLIINGGSFGHRFCELCKHHDIPYESIDLKWDEELTQKHLSVFNGRGFTALLVNLHETSTGQLYDIQMLSNFCKKNEMYLIVDAISTFMADDFNMDKYAIDVTIFSSQKGLSLSPGLSFIALSQRMKERVFCKKTVTQYFCFKDYLDNMVRGQTPYTPAVCIIHELNAILNLIESIGKEKWLANIAEKSVYFRKSLSKYGLSYPTTYPLSNMMTPVLFGTVNAYDVFLELQNKYNIFVNPCGGELSDKMIRVAHVGNTTISDFDELLKKIDTVVSEIKNKGIKK